MFLSAFNFGLSMISTLFGFFLGIQLGDGITIGGLFFVVLTFSVLIGFTKKLLGYTAESSSKAVKGRL